MTRQSGKGTVRQKPAAHNLALLGGTLPSITKKKEEDEERWGPERRRGVQGEKTGDIAHPDPEVSRAKQRAP